MTRLAPVACLLVCALDLVQLAIRPWGAARLGAIAGAVLYALAAVLIGHRHPVGTWIARLVPAIPTTLIVANAVAGTLPDPWMVSIYAVQLIAAYGAWGPTEARPQA